MAKTTAPLLSFGASGQIAKTQVYASWRGIPYARRHVIPANPRTANQLQTRNIFGFLNAIYKLLDANAILPWTAFAKGRPFTNRNAFIKSNVLSMNGASGTPHTDLSGFVGSPGAGGGSAASALALADGGGHVIDVTLTAPTLPAGWSITRAQAVAIKEQNPHDMLAGVPVYGQDTTSPYAPTLSMGSAGTYQVTAWFEYMKPDATLAYGPSLTDTVVLA